MVFPDASPAGQRTFAEVFGALEAGTVDRAVVPVEISLAGIVQEVNVLLWVRRAVVFVA